MGYVVLKIAEVPAVMIPAVVFHADDLQPGKLIIFANFLLVKF